MISRDAKVVVHRTVRPRIDIGGVPKSTATRNDDWYRMIFLQEPPKPQPYLSDVAEQDRIWKLVEQFSVTSGDTREALGRDESEGRLAIHDQD